MWGQAEKGPAIVGGPDAISDCQGGGERILVSARSSYEDAVGRPLSMFVKTDLTLLPIRVMAAMHPTIIRANITAYSVAVGPSSLRRKDWIFLTSVFISDSSRQVGPAVPASSETRTCHWKHTKRFNFKPTVGQGKRFNLEDLDGISDSENCRGRVWGQG